MKTPLRLSILLLTAVALLAIPPLVTGCKSSPETIAYKATGTVVVGVNAAMKEWHDYVAAGKASVAQQQKVKGVYDKYYAAVQVEKDAITAYKTNQDKTLLQQVIGGAEAAQADLVTLIESFLPPETVIKLKGG